MRIIQDTESSGIAALSVIGSLLPQFKNATTTRGLNYHYYFSAPTSGKPTVLLVHGFPSIAIDWHPQITFFKEKGYGVIAPDMLGYGGTDKPKESKEYVHSLLASDLVNILDHENVKDVVAVGHDWGSKTVGMLANLYDNRFIGFGFLAAGYMPPGTAVGEIDELRETSVALFGYEAYGYWEFFAAADAPNVIDSHRESFTDLVYAKDARLPRFNAGPQGSMRVFLESDTRTPRFPIFTEDQAALREKEFGEYGFDGPLNYYRVNLNGEATEDDQKVPLDKFVIQKPVFFGGARRDVICVNWFHEALTRKFSPTITVVNFDVGHWVAAEAAKEVNEALEEWIDGIVLA